ncbi:MAG: CRISPR-associated helicase Cas3' [Nitrospira sp.]|nr:CRISPR-associated helicase Cas3' [Nitrospira sp.]
MSEIHQFANWFARATGNEPYPFQIRFACEPELPELVDVPTGMGKTAMAVLGWLWRRRFGEVKVRKATPRRLVYCLPMRVLVEQTASEANKWIAELEKHYPKEMTHPLNIHILMGGEDEEDWDIYPECDQIIIGTQDMLLSRALNRGYAATRSRWPVKFGLLNTDCLWVFDEIQLMGTGLATTTQLEAFRRLLPDKDSDRAKNGHGCRSVWMSATLRREWLKTVDFVPFLDEAQQIAFDFEQEMNNSGQNQKARQALEDRWRARKPLVKTKAVMGDESGLAQEIHKAHIHKPGTRTIVIVNTVKRACALVGKLEDLYKDAGKESSPRIVLLHSRFRPGDRKKQVDKALAEIKSDEPGTIVVSTQVIEAGVDVSATTLFTELAPWASLVQRFGRCNRRGAENDRAAVHWITMPTKGSGAEKVVAPYDLMDLKTAAEQLEKLSEKELSDVGLRTLRDQSLPLRFEHTHVIRRKDLIDLFDTTPDLAGNDIDIDRFIRDVEKSDVRVFWRDYDKTPNELDDKEPEPAPRRDELCPVPIEEFQDFVRKHMGQVWRWNFLDKKWEKVDAGKVAPGHVFLIQAKARGYSTERGWHPDSNTIVVPIPSLVEASGDAQDATDNDPLSHIGVWQTIAKHTDELCQEVEDILDALAEQLNEGKPLRLAARWHDRGKAHEVFRKALPDGSPDPEKFWAKAPGQWKKYDRRHFRHELASALSVLDPRNDKIPSELRDIVAYLVASHHGKVRLSIRSLPNEKRPDSNRRFARGIWDDDELPAANLGGNGIEVIAPAVRLSLEPMELGLCEEEPFHGLPSWAERMIGLRDTLGPFRLAYLEAILRAADMRASRDAEQRAVAKQHDPVSPHGKREVAS